MCITVKLPILYKFFTGNPTIYRSPNYCFPSDCLEPEFLDEIQTKVLRVFLLAIHSHLNSFAFRFQFLQTHETSYNSYSSVTVKEKGRKPGRKAYPLPYGLRNPYKNIKSENSKDYDQKPQRKCTFMNSASGSVMFIKLLKFLVT
jgi:hypothetical protein